MNRRIISFVLVVLMLCSVGIPARAVETEVDSTKETVFEFDSGNAALQTALEQIKPLYIESFYSLSPEQKMEKRKNLSLTYSAGDILSEADSAFVLLDRYESEKRPQVRAGASEEWYDVYKTQYGVKVNLYGWMKQDIAFIAGSSRFGGTATLWVQSGSVSRVDLSIHHTAYGLIGTSAPFVGVLYNGSVSMSKSGNNTTTKMDKETEYGSILPLYTTMYASATVNTSAGDEFTITTDTWEEWH